MFISEFWLETYQMTMSIPSHTGLYKIIINFCENLIFRLVVLGRILNSRVATDRSALHN